MSIIIYSDGSAAPTNPGPGGWAFLLIGPSNESVRWEISGSEKYSTNNRMELKGAIEGLCWSKAWSPDIQRLLYTDSEYVKRGITEWIQGWKRNGWKTSAKKPVKNQELWMMLDDLVNSMNVSWFWVKAHANDPNNNLVDELARQAALERYRSCQ